MKKENVKSLGEIGIERGPWAVSISFLFLGGVARGGGQHNLYIFII